MVRNDKRIATEGTTLPMYRCHECLGLRNACTGFAYSTIFSTPVESIAAGGVGIGTFPIAFPIYPHLQPRGGSDYQLWRWFELTVHQIRATLALIRPFINSTAIKPAHALPTPVLAKHIISNWPQLSQVSVVSDRSFFPHMSCNPKP